MVCPFVELCSVMRIEGDKLEPNGTGVTVDLFVLGDTDRLEPGGTGALINSFLLGWLVWRY